MSGLEVMGKPCDQCLFSKNKIVTDESKVKVLADCARNDSHFECHKGTLVGRKIVCAGFAKRGTSQMLQIAQRLRAIVIVDPKNVPSHRSLLAARHRAVALTEPETEEEQEEREQEEAEASDHE